MRKWFIAIASALLVVNLFLIDYQQPGDSQNFGPYAGLAAMILVIMSQVFSMRHEKKHSEDN